MTAIKASVGGATVLLWMNMDRLIALGVVATALAVAAGMSPR